MRISPLPPLQALIAFEAVMRHGSFTRAANELHLTQSAISRQVAQLERFLGKKLFLRERRTLRLTVSGQIYAEQVQRLLVSCAESTGALMKNKGGSELTIACSSGATVLWLAPRLGNFRAEHPEVHLRLIVNDSLSSLSESDFDVGIYYLREGAPKGLAARRIYGEEVFPVCSPKYLAGRTILPVDLPKEMLLMLEDGQRQWMSWEAWFAQNGISTSRFQTTLVANHYPLLIQLAIEGGGIVLGWRHMIDSCIDSGLLVRACKGSASASLGGGYYTVWPSDRAESTASYTFRKWIMLESVRKGSPAE
ncbi:LysR substrate-binding domain-containing protein [Herbaspirillum sp. RTI4]|uniref:LysR substrate-binding domain-containing protein n=1 Tax=Herbaspirillum sp. RTI4 TaxID=3048640 RepID=UPI002AB40A4A|nr:LysR substrate-binding domain-containing protein [Herbaspirillum sp. RTI4]MDY7577210.1 LysR substrate-binding domain-containing protein [Herbaspirillum sp. RTI4]MEA9980500.1 LysR substrate-binding domain-containing protein [Herbaspirillum sp. RTI4]